MVHGLLFSGVAASALNPFDVSKFEAGSTRRLLANIYNLVGAVVFVLLFCAKAVCVCGVVFVMCRPEPGPGCDQKY